MPVFYDRDADLSRLTSRRIAVIGYGSQGRAHAQNLRDSGVDVVVGLRQGSRSGATASTDGLTTAPIAEAVAASEIVMVLIPDQEQGTLYSEQIGPALKRGATLLFAHGFNVHFGAITPRLDIDVALVAPKAPGPTVRSEYIAGRGVPGLVAVHQNNSGEALETALAWAKGIGCTRAGVLQTSFREETETDLFGEQVVLCGGTTALVQAGFETLVEAGYSPEMAYFECLHELKLIVDLMNRGGIGFMRRAISDTAEYGDRTRGSRIIGESSRQAMREILAEIRDGSFAREWLAEHRAGAPRLTAARAKDGADPMESVGATLRAMMPWSADAALVSTP